MANILVAGGMDYNGDTPVHSQLASFASDLGASLVGHGHTILGGCRTKLDAVIAKAAADAAMADQKDPRAVMRSWVTTSTEPSHQHGEITRSLLDNWTQVPLRHKFPEPVREADAVIILGGWEGTHYAATWARLANKPLVPVAAFGLAAADIYIDELQDFERKYAERIAPQDYEILNRVMTDATDEDALRQLADDIVVLAERLVQSKDVFVVMSFADTPELADAYDTFQRACADNGGYRAFRVDEHLDAGQRIVPAVIDAIRSSAFVIADLTHPKPNVYYELGFAQALGKTVITTAKDGTELPFDVFDVPTLFWDSQRQLEQKLKAKIGSLAGR